MILLNIFTCIHFMTPLLYQDFTIKARAKDFVRVEELLRELGAKFLGVDVQTDTYFKTEKGKLKIREGNIENLITHYERILENGMERTIVYRYDVNPTEAEIENLMTSTQSIGVVKKNRSIYLLGIHKIHLDRLTDGDFIEIESIDRDGRFTSSELKRLCWELKEKLEICDNDLMPTGYFNLTV
jgi:adenylate cyclase, class 2